MDPSQDFKSLQEKVQNALIQTIKSANRIAVEDLGFQRTVNPTIGDRLEDQTSRLLSLSSELLEAAGKTTSQKLVGSLEDGDDVDMHWRGIVDVVDGLLEKADTCLDEYTGLVKRKGDFPTAETGPKNKKPRTNEKLDFNIRRANIVKPQNGFEQKFNNFNQGPWKPILTVKPHATLPLEKSLGTFKGENEPTQYKHPYETEILNLTYPASTFENREPIPYQPVETTSATWVDTFEGVLDMLGELKQAKEIAVDLEHHDYRTYSGLLSLMQISTREKDWIVDTLKPWRHKLEVLNEVFADPSIVKVFHGAFMDIIWLQRDLGLYIVGLFDTYHASVSLNYGGRSLAYLLSKVVGFEADKKYQMADWRIRPLTEEMFYYARSDTHFLLYVYDKMRNELVEQSDRNDPEKDLIGLTLQNSKEVSLLRYEGLTADPESGEGSRGWYNVLCKTPTIFNSEQFAVYKAVHKWRDDLSRRHDESPVYIMPQPALTEIAKIIPTDMKALWALLGQSSQIVKSSADELFALVQEAKASGSTGPSTMQFFRGETVASAVAKVFSKDRASEVEVPSAQELRSETSQLWGLVPMSSKWDEPSKQLQQESSNSQIALPWTTFVHEAISQLPQTTAAAEAMNVDENVSMIPLDSAKERQAEVPQDKAEADNTEFTLRLGRKRKIEEAESSDSDSDSDGEDGGAKAGLVIEEMISLNEDDDKKLVKKQRKAQAKQERRAEREAEKETKRVAKKQKKLEKALKAVAKGAPEGDEDEDEQPFDYTQAQSILHAKKMANDAEPAKKTFDPYLKKMSAEGPKPARRTHGEKPGKTATFKK